MGSKAPRYLIIDSCFSKASANVASLLRPTMYCFRVPNFLALLNSSANPKTSHQIGRVNSDNTIKDITIYAVSVLQILTKESE